MSSVGKILGYMGNFICSYECLTSITFLKYHKIIKKGFRYLRLEEISCSHFAQGITSHSNIFGGPAALFKDGLNFDELPLKIIGFCKQCVGKLHGPLRQWSK